MEENSPQPSVDADESNDSSDSNRILDPDSGPFTEEPEKSLHQLGFYERFPANFVVMRKFAKFAEERGISNTGAASRFIRKLYSLAGINPSPGNESVLFVPALYQKTMELLKNLVEKKKMAPATGNFGEFSKIFHFALRVFHTKCHFPKIIFWNFPKISTRKNLFKSI